MADAKPVQGEKAFGFLTRKVGPLPVIGWGLLAAGGYLVYRHFHPSTPAATTPTTSTPTGTGTGNISVFASNRGGTTTTTKTGGVTPPTPPPNGKVKVPNVVGMGDTLADTTIAAAGLKPKDANEKKGGFGKSIGDYSVASTQPAANTLVAPGSDVTITFVKKKPTVTKAPAETAAAARSTGNGTTRATTPATATQQEMASAPTAVQSTDISTASPQSLSGGNEPVVYEGPVYGLWTTAQQGLADMGSEGGPGVDIIQSADTSSGNGTAPKTPTKIPTPPNTGTGIAGKPPKKFKKPRPKV